MQAWDCVKNSFYQKAPANFFSLADIAASRQLFGDKPLTPLLRLNALTAKLGLSAIYLKDESRIFGLNAFKGRGALWAMSKILAEKTGSKIDELDKLKNTETFTFVSATDGNHGAALAYAASLFGQKAVIFMPKGSAKARIKAIEAFGAQCIVSKANYDATVELAAEFAAKSQAILMQDTAWPGYEDAPALIMQGYASIASEVARQLGDDYPTHVFLQAGVGSFAAAMIAAFDQLWPVQPVYLTLEPEKAACVYHSIAKADGNSHIFPGDLETIMAGLACGKVSSIAWPILLSRVKTAVKCHDSLAVQGMLQLAQPFAGDPAIMSGESGAIGAGLLTSLDASGRRSLDLDQNSRVLLISTEGATDPENWQRLTGLAIHRQDNQQI